MEDEKKIKTNHEAGITEEEIKAAEDFAAKEKELSTKENFKRYKASQVFINKGRRRTKKKQKRMFWIRTDD
jgi:hypothetical protein